MRKRITEQTCLSLSCVAAGNDVFACDEPNFKAKCRFEQAKKHKISELSIPAMRIAYLRGIDGKRLTMKEIERRYLQQEGIEVIK